jgi:hypothetical protein
MRQECADSLRFFGPYAPDALTAYVSAFSYFKKFERFTTLATGSGKKDP